MNTIMVMYWGDIPAFIENIPKEYERSCKGVLHILPMKPKKITIDEYMFIRKKYKHIAKKIRYL